MGFEWVNGGIKGSKCIASTAKQDASSGLGGVGDWLEGTWSCH